MSFDFAKVGSSGVIADITEPAALFDALPNKAVESGYLRAVQKAVLDEWSERSHHRGAAVGRLDDAAGPAGERER